MFGWFPAKKPLWLRPGIVVNWARDDPRPAAKKQRTREIQDKVREDGQSLGHQTLGFREFVLARKNPHFGESSISLKNKKLEEEVHHPMTCIN